MSIEDPGLGPAADTRAEQMCGRWGLRYEGDEISQITLDGIQVVDAVRPALRDRNWSTVAPEFTDEDLLEGKSTDAPRLVRMLGSTYRFGEGEGTGRTTLEIAGDRLVVRFEFVAREPVTTNRTGLTIALPRTMAGDDATVGTSAGEMRDFRFPRQISAWQPLFDIRSLDIAHEDARFRLDLLGDVFEMEDQRNWCDASYKIYSRSLSRPFPYVIEAGQRVVQEIAMTAEPGASAPSIGVAGAETATVRGLRDPGSRSTPVRTVMPRLGIGATTSYEASAEAVASFGPSLGGDDGIASLTVEVSDRFDVDEPLRRAAREARAAGLGVDLRVNATNTVDLAHILAVLDGEDASLRRIGIVSADTHVTTCELMTTLRDAVGDREVELLAASRTHFTELNRQIHRLPRDIGTVGFAYTPQMHMQETWHVVESIATLGDALRSVQDLLGEDVDIVLGPVCLRPRVNAVATQVDQVDRADRTGYGAHLVPGSTDPRQHTIWAAAWVGAVIAEAAAAGVREITLMEMCGPRGVVPAGGTDTALRRLLTVLAGWGEDPVTVQVDPQGSGTAVLTHGGQSLLVNARQHDVVLQAPAPDDGPMRAVPVAAGNIVAVGW
jgi:hypothetical protein